MGATSVRVAAVDLMAPRPEVEVLHRWHHAPLADEQGQLRWDWTGLVAQVEAGLTRGLESGPVASIGIDGWGVDYGLLDEDGRLLDQPFCYRDDRTAGWQAKASEIGTDLLYGTTGVQLMGINTVFQLAFDAPGRLARAAHMLLLPDLLLHRLSGWVGAERSNMSTTGLMDARTRGWADGLIEAVGAPRRLFPTPTDAGVTVGAWRGVPLTLVGSHDTASAFLGAPAQPGASAVFVSAGSWVIVGKERPAPDTSELARALNFSNEAGALGGVRFLKNVVGFWMLERCLAAWGDASIETIVTEAGQVDVPVPVFDAADHRFMSSDDLLGEVMAATGLSAGAPRAQVARSIIESIVVAVVRVIDELRQVTGEAADSVVLVGGGARIPLFAELLRERSGLDVVVGSPEATTLGNAVVQGIALGTFTDQAEARAWLNAAATAT